MMNVNLFCIGGIISPSEPPGTSQYSNCRVGFEEYPLREIPPRTSPIISKTNYSFSVALLEESLENEQAQTPNFWKKRLITCFSLTNLCSVTFIPFDLTSNHTLFLQRDVTGPPLKGFFAPYLSEKKQHKWGCIRADEGMTHELNTIGDIIPSLENIDSESRLEILNILYCFLEDPLTASIGITFRKTVGKLAESLTTHFWAKRKQIK